MAEGSAESASAAVREAAAVVLTTISCVLEKRPPTSGPAMVAYSPNTGFTPTNAPFASPSGTFAMATFRPASASCRPSARVRNRRLATAGTASYRSSGPGCEASTSSSSAGVVTRAPGERGAGPYALFGYENRLPPLLDRNFRIVIVAVSQNLDLDPVHLASEAYPG